jgi:hypothetical protein
MEGFAMGRVWALALGLILALLVVFLSGPLDGARILLTASICVGGGAAASFLGSPNHMFARGVWLFVGVLFGAIGYVLGAAVFPDTTIGLFFGGVVPITLTALATMWTKRQTDFLAGILGAGALTGVYAFQFNLDPQSLNYSLPVAMGQTIYPLGLGFLFAMVVQWLTKSDAEAEATKKAKSEATTAEVADAAVEVNS